SEALLQGTDIFLEYLECVISRKANGQTVTIRDIISGNYLNDLIASATPSQTNAGILQILVELNEKPLNFLAGVEYEFYPYLLLQEGDWVLSEGGDFEQVDADWFYNGSGHSPYWFAGGWPFIEDSGNCLSFCDGWSAGEFGCIEVTVPLLTITDGGFSAQGCTTICLPEGIHCGITVKQDALTDWTTDCSSTRGQDTWITQTCWARSPNPCFQEEGFLSCEDQLNFFNPQPGDLVVDYQCSAKAVKIHLSQWQTFVDELGPIFDYCYPYVDRAFIDEGNESFAFLEELEEIAGKELADLLLEIESDVIDYLIEEVLENSEGLSDEELDVEIFFNIFRDPLIIKVLYGSELFEVYVKYLARQ